MDIKEQDKSDNVMPSSLPSPEVHFGRHLCRVHTTEHWQSYREFWAGTGPGTWIVPLSWLRIFTSQTFKKSPAELLSTHYVTHQMGRTLDPFDSQFKDDHKGKFLPPSNLLPIPEHKQRLVWVNLVTKEVRHWMLHQRLYYRACWLMSTGICSNPPLRNKNILTYTEKYNVIY